jgi:hypothetical protein
MYQSGQAVTVTLPGEPPQDGMIGGFSHTSNRNTAHHYRVDVANPVPNPAAYMEEEPSHVRVRTITVQDCYLSPR